MNSPTKTKEAFITEAQAYLYHKVEALHGTADCKEILRKHASKSEVEERLHHKLICWQLVGEAAGLVYEQLKTGNN